MNCWKTLGIKKTTDQKIIKEAYALKIKENHPEDSMDDFIVLKEAYKQAINYAKWTIRFNNDQKKQQEKSVISFDDDVFIDNDQQDRDEETNEDLIVNKDEEDMEVENDEQIVIDFDNIDKSPVISNLKSVIGDQEQIDLYSEKALIDDFFIYLTETIHSSKIKEQVYWSTITGQWFFKYFRNSAYFQESFWEFFYDIKFSSINAPTRKYIILPFLNDFLAQTDYQIARDFNASDIIMRCSLNLSGKTKQIKSSNLYKPKNMLFKKYIFKYRSLYFLIYEANKIITILGWLLLVAFIIYLILSL